MFAAIGRAARTRITDVLPSRNLGSHPRRRDRTAGPSAFVGAQGARLPARAIEGEDQLLMEAFLQRVRIQEAAELPDQLPVATECEPTWRSSRCGPTPSRSGPQTSASVHCSN